MPRLKLSKSSNILVTLFSTLAVSALVGCTNSMSDSTLTPSPESSLKPSGTWSLQVIGAADKPPMGWNSWNAFRTDVNEEKVIGAAEAIVNNGLAALGYKYINIDDGWWLKRRSSDNELVVRTAIFPSAKIEGGGIEETNFKPFVDRIHSMGLKAGIYSEVGRNACSQAWDLKSPNLPEGGRAEREVGSFNHVDQDIKLFFKKWGFDYIKVDACGLADFWPEKELVVKHDYTPVEPMIYRGNINRSNTEGVRSLFENLRKSLIQYNPDNDFVYSICSWGEANSRQWGKDTGNLWRSSGDIHASWESMLHNFDTVATRALFAGPGTWNDPDMLFIGKGDFDINHLTEAKSHFSLWSIVAAPLLIGHDLRNAPKELFDIWKAEEVIAINQDSAGHQGVLAYSNHDIQIMVKTLSKRGEKAVTILNRGTNIKKVTLNAEHLKFDATKAIAVRDVWKREALDNFIKSKTFTVQPHQTLMFRVTGVPKSEGTYLSEIPAHINVAVDGVIDRPIYADFGAPRADASPFNKKIRLNNITYPYGIGALVNSRLEVKASKKYKEFSTVVGIDDSSFVLSEKVVFEVYGDGKLLASSQALGFNDTPERLNVNVSGIDVIELIANQKGTDKGPVVIAWADALLK